MARRRSAGDDAAEAAATGGVAWGVGAASCEAVRTWTTSPWAVPGPGEACSASRRP